MRGDKRLEELLQQYGGLICHIASDWKRHEAEFGDLEQAGRIALWKAMLVDEHATDSFYKQRIRWGIANEAVRLRLEPINESLDVLLAGNMDFDDLS